jgi:hypothetical protein
MPRNPAGDHPMRPGVTQSIGASVDVQKDGVGFAKGFDPFCWDFAGCGWFEGEREAWDGDGAGQDAGW